MFKANQELDIPAALGLLTHLTNDELKDLLNNDNKFEDIVKDIKQFKDLEAEKEMLMASNRSLAEFNLSKQPELQDGKQILIELSETGNKLCANVKAKLEELKEKSGEMTVDTALDLLQTAAAEIEEESETIAEKFLAGDMEVDEFLEQFLSRRKLMHLRKVKVDKLKEIIRKSHSSGGPGYPIAANFPGIAPAIPYPTGPVSMPMPVPSGLPHYRPY
ncbi:PREDICTED: vacuolar protein sorting-associated protein 37B [Dufourea novaeangliae]|uniref:Vacuolar protein sorting-associated protein 37B n=1 Tax=Dufourea novaeangliae TaxID=178035 RepID=A0A154PQX0_DUFNO|nr:PREDICTED: vacuolar protein sorting-associated protein 37B [Dufourea novaeangliae]KZC14292.1 Vacuolar protein sorting-associated protein 37B [Dufourea novaeangliae]